MVVPLQEIKTIDQFSVAPALNVSEVMSLRDIHSPADIKKWRDHNHKVAEYLAKYIRRELFAEETKLREDYIHSVPHIPEEIRSAMRMFDNINIASEHDPEMIVENFSLAYLDPPSIDEQITLFDENHPRVQQLRLLEQEEEIHTEAITYLADMLGVPMMTIYTAGIHNGTGGHALALVRTPYQQESGEWVCDVMDPMSLEPTIGYRILGVHDKEEAFRALGNMGRANTIGLHFLHNRIEYNLFQEIGEGPFEMFCEHVRLAGVGALQEGESVNCQFMSLLIQAYLWRFYGSITSPEDAGGLAGLNVGNIIDRQFGLYFNTTIKNIFDIASQTLFLQN